MSDYNGWKNRATWNVALWINNDAERYEQARGFMSYAADNKDPMAAVNPYQRFVYINGLGHTPDGYSYTDESLDIEALDEMMRDL
jgi:hypothetical protein